jgi:hypothetical protein
MDPLPFRVGDVLESVNPASLARKVRIDVITEKSFTATVIEGPNTKDPLLVYRAGWGMYRNRSEPKRVQLTKDFLDLKAGIGFPKDTMLIRSAHSGQYITEGLPLGAPCVTGYFLIRDICKIIDP